MFKSQFLIKFCPNIGWQQNWYKVHLREIQQLKVAVAIIEYERIKYLVFKLKKVEDEIKYSFIIYQAKGMKMR